MPKYQRFEDLPVWQEAARLYNLVLDLFEQPKISLSSGFRNQLDRAALSVSNNIAEGFDRIFTGDLMVFIGFARGSTAEVSSMIAVVGRRPKLREWRRDLESIRESADCCARQLTGWVQSLEESPVQGKRHLNHAQRRGRDVAENAREFKRNFLQNLKPEHPLYRSAEARAARGELPEE